MKSLKGILLASIAFASSTADAQDLAAKKNIDKLCGCFDVEFKYAETFSPDTAYKFHDREKISGGTELILPVEVSDKKIVMQHLLVISDDMVIKHWREDWTYENPVVWKYVSDKTWKKTTLSKSDVKGRWTQTVWEVSDAPRYQGFSEWVKTDGQVFWQNTVDAPLPRREYTQRHDYNILRRTNRIVLQDAGWVHEQDNRKIKRTDAGDKLIAEEKGINRYTRIDDSKCAAALAFWKKSATYWAKVKASWDTYMTGHDVVTLQTRIDGKLLHEQLDEIARDFTKGKVADNALDGRINGVLEKYLAYAPAKRDDQPGGTH